MKQITVTLVVRDEDADTANEALRSSQILNEWPVYEWVIADAKQYQVSWFENEYMDRN